MSISALLMFTIKHTTQLHFGWVVPPAAHAHHTPIHTVSVSWPSIALMAHFYIFYPLTTNTPIIYNMSNLGNEMKWNKKKPIIINVAPELT